MGLSEWMIPGLDEELPPYLWGLYRQLHRSTSDGTEYDLYDLVTSRELVTSRTRVYSVHRWSRLARASDIGQRGQQVGKCKSSGVNTTYTKIGTNNLLVLVVLNIVKPQLQSPATSRIPVYTCHLSR